MKKSLISLFLILPAYCFADVEVATAKVQGLGNNKISGTVTFAREQGKGIKVDVDLVGVPAGQHGFHIHEFGNCEGDGTAAGGHFSAPGQEHSDRKHEKRHTGDLGNLLADKSGKVKTSFYDGKLKLNGVYSVLGRGIILHADADDQKTQPTGNAGARIACGAIFATK